MIASFGMYELAETRAATDALWTAIARALGLEGVAIDRERSFEDALADPSLVLGEMCGYPLTHGFAGRVRVVATPCRPIAGCEEGGYRSLVVVRDAHAKLEDLRGAVVAINDHGSHSGKHALGALVAPLAREGEPFFRRTLVTGSHAESLACVARGEADVAAIDCITHALLARHRPHAVAGTRVLAETPSAPAPPLVTRAWATDADLAALRDALARAAADPSLAAARDALFVSSFRVLDDAAYARILDLERAHAGAAVFGP
ncbi:MAG TPA: PhnD/SsuA/transferrin family substrate-binding protein [Labilithrix sp.]